MSSEEDKEKKVYESASTMTELVMPNHTNPLGNLMGGNLMKWMDVIAGICAGKHAEAHVVTANVDHVSFDKPIHVGDVVTIEAKVTRAFNSSVEIFVEVSANDVKGASYRKCNHAYFTFVAVDDEKHRPIPIPKVSPMTAGEKRRYKNASIRREIRLLVAGRIEANEAMDLKNYFTKLN